MAELRRLLIDRHRLEQIMGLEIPLSLNNKEGHYLKRVLRLKSGDLVALVDGYGNLWEAAFQGGNELLLTTPLDSPLQIQPRPKPLICLAVVIPKRGLDDVLRMSTEIGIDIIQPLTSERCCVKEKSIVRVERWRAIVREAVEQSERLWSPQLLETIDFYEFLNIVPAFNLGIATTRLAKSKNCDHWLKEKFIDAERIWIAIGPEGGWTSKEEALALNSGCEPIQLGETILRTSTAAIVASQSMALGRRTVNLSLK